MNLDFINNPHNAELVRKLRADGYKVIHFLRLDKFYVFSTSAEMRAVAAICDPSKKTVLYIDDNQFGSYLSKIIRAGYRVVIG